MQNTPETRQPATPLDLNELWIKFGDDVGINQKDETDVPFLHFPAGTYRFEIWKWFEEQGFDVVGHTT